jgi:hypothetical protein
LRICVRVNALHFSHLLSALLRVNNSLYSFIACITKAPANKGLIVFKQSFIKIYFAAVIIITI